MMKQLLVKGHGMDQINELVLREAVHRKAQFNSESIKSKLEKKVIKGFAR